jgi:branched-chain amino acid transport system permease protein
VVAWLYQLSRFGRMLRATREDPAAAQAVGVSIHRQRLIAFTLSGALCGFAGGLFVHEAGTITTEDVYLNLTFLTLAMLVVGGVGSLLGAVVGALLISGLDSFLKTAESGVHVLGFKLDLIDGTHLVVLGAVMAFVLVLRPSGITGGREFRLPRSRHGRQPAEAPR